MMSPLAEHHQAAENPQGRGLFRRQAVARQAGIVRPPPAAPPEQKIAVCRICHQPNFEGGLPAPRLAGQSYEYLVGAMTSFAEERAPTTPDMTMLMKMLPAEERDAIAKYLAAL